MPRSRRHELGVGVLVLVALAVLAWMSLKVGALKGLGDEIEVSVVFDDAAGLTEGATVRVAGVEVGRVQKLAVDHDRALVTLRLRRDAGLRQDVIAQVRARSVLGEKYVAMSPQGRDTPLLADGDVVTRTLGQTEIDQLVNSMGPLVGAVDAEALQQAIATLSKALEDDPERIARMLDDVETLLDNAALASAEAPALVAETRQTLAAVRQVSADARPVIRRADATLAQVEAATTDLPATRAEVDLLLRDARGAVEDTRGLMSRVDGKMGDVERLIDNLSEIDKWELRRLLREEGIVIRLREHEVVPTEP